jgi:hypothetical protein
LADTSFKFFYPFSDLFVDLAIAEVLECQSTKGETLKEMEAFEKAGLNHPAGEVTTIAYALCQSAPPFFSKQISVLSRKNYLKGLKTPEDCDYMAGDHVFPRLKQKIKLCMMEYIQAERNLETMMPKGVVWSMLQTASARHVPRRSTKGQRWFCLGKVGTT